MSTGPTVPTPAPVPPPLNLGQIGGVILVVLVLVFGLQFLGGHLRLSWVGPAPTPAPRPVEPTPGPPAPTPKPFPSVWLEGRMANA